MRYQGLGICLCAAVYGSFDRIVAIAQVLLTAAYVKPPPITAAIHLSADADGVTKAQKRRGLELFSGRGRRRASEALAEQATVGAS